MANELEQTTINAAGTGYVDNVPGAISTGYQAQNTNITARTVGQDLTSVKASGADVVIEISGPVDVDGLPFNVTSEVTLTPPSADTYYIRVIDGATTTQKSLELTTDTPVWDGTKNANYDASGNRMLNWLAVFDGSDSVVYRVLPTSGGLSEIGALKTNKLTVDTDIEAGGTLSVVGTMFDKDPELFETGNLSVGANSVLPKGMYRFAYKISSSTTTKSGSVSTLQQNTYVGSSLQWAPVADDTTGLYISNGADLRVLNEESTTYSFYFYKW